jgi:hypothetical protein
MTSHRFTRRRFLRSSVAGASLGFGGYVGRLPAVAATSDDADVTPELVHFSADIEPIVRLIEETPRERCVSVFVDELRRGLPYRHFLAAQYLAAIRAARYHAGRPQGYSHNAFVVHAVHQLSLDLPPAERLLPCFYNIDNFKGMQAGYGKVTGTPELTGALPPAEKAETELHAAMREWDPDRAERAVVALARSQGAAGVFEPLWHYGARDWGFIGHNAIVVSNSCRLLDTIGWQHAEPLLRFVVQGLAGWPARPDDHPDLRPYSVNRERTAAAVHRLPGDWADRRDSEGLTKELVGMIRTGNSLDACELVVAQLTEGKAQAQAAWDAVYLAIGELHLNVKLPEGHQWNGNALHANTVTNALYYAFRASLNDENRLLCLLQAIGWLGLFRDSLQNKLSESNDVLALTAADLPDQEASAVEEILATRSADPLEACRKSFAFAQRSTDSHALFWAANRQLALKARDVHDIKFAVAVEEDLALASPRWQPQILAASAYSFQGTGRPDNPILQQAKEALQDI